MGWDTMDAGYTAESSVRDHGPPKEIAYYYPNPMWRHGDWVKSLIVFFDGVALLVPEYMKDKPELVDPAIVAGLNEHDLLHILQPEQVVDATATAQLATALTDIITSGVLDDLPNKTDFHELSMSRFGYYGDSGLAEIFDELKTRGLAKRQRRWQIHTDAPDGAISRIGSSLSAFALLRTHDGRRAEPDHGQAQSNWSPL
jgi:hypothetical protein